jgi:hypothetical protein
MTKQIEFGWVKDIPKVPRMGLVRFELSYAVDLNDNEMVDHAKECLYEDVMSIVKHDETFNGIRVEENTEVSYDDIPEFLLEEEDME